MLQMAQAPQFNAMPVTIGIPGGFHFAPEYASLYEESSVEESVPEKQGRRYCSE